MLLDRYDLAGQLCRLAARCRADIERAVARQRADGERSELRAAALRPDPAFGQRLLVHALDAVGAGNVGRLAVDLAANEPDDGLGRLVLRAHERQCVVAAEVALPHLRNPVRVRELERPLRQTGKQAAETYRQPAHDRVRERDRPLEPCRAHELHRFVDRGVPRDPGQVRELIRAGPQRRPYRRVESRHRPPRERLDAVVERPRALHGAVGDLLGERAIARIESLRRGRERSIGVGVLLEHAQDDLVRGPPCGRHRHQRRPRSQEA